VRAIRQRSWAYLRPCLVGFALFAAIYCGMFCYRFDILSDPVINRERGWLGPRVRGDRHTIDVGEVGYYESSGYALYDFYGPLCHVWIFCNGLNYHGS
jgi:hypothetical protein